MRKETMTKTNIVGACAYRYGFREKRPGIWNHVSRPFRFRLSPRKLYFEICADGKHYETVFSFWVNRITHTNVKAVEYYLNQHF